MLLMLLWLLFSVIVAVYARSRGRSLLGYFVLALLVSPLITFVVLLLIGPNDTRPCPHCAERIKTDAVVCRYCGGVLPPGRDPPPPA